MTQGVDDEHLDVVGGDEVPAVDGGVGSGDLEEAEASPGAGSHLYHGVVPGGSDYVADVVDYLVVDVDVPLYEILHRHELLLVGHRLDDVGGIVPPPVDSPLQDQALLVLRLHVSHGQLDEEAVHLGLRERIRALELDGVLGGDDEEGGCEPVGLTFDGDLPLLHGLEQRGLSLRGRPVYLVGEEEVCEYRPLLKNELGLGEAPDPCAEDV